MNKDLRRVLSLPEATYPDGLAETMSAAWRAPGGTWVLRDEQARFLYSLAVYGGAVGALGVGSGKAQPLTEVVWTPTGPRRMGDLRVGDFVLAGDGTPTQVTGYYPRPARRVYTVRFSDGAEVDACEDHLWAVTTKTTRRYGTPVHVVSTLDLIERTTGNRHAFEVPTGGEAQFDGGEPLPITPWLLGALIRGGRLTADAVAIYSDDPDVRAEFRFWVEAYGLEYRETGTSTHGGVVASGRTSPQGASNPLLDSLRELGLAGRRSWEVTLPTRYLLGNVTARRALLAGLMDLGGSTDPSRSTTYFGTQSSALADGVVHLVRSLGGVASVSTRKARGNVRETYTVSLSFPDGRSPFSVGRRGAGFEARRRPRRRRVTEVVYKGVEDCACISVAHPSHLYLTRDFVVTHNTLTSMLAPLALGVPSDNVLVLLPASLIPEAWKERPAYEAQFNLPEPPVYMSYEMLSHRNHVHRLTELAPSVILCDEAHRLRNTKTAAVAKRVQRYLRRNPDTVFAPMSGTFTGGSLLDYAHLARWALGSGCPLPVDRPILEAWSRVMDVDTKEPPTAVDYRRVEPLKAWAGEDKPRRALYKRVTSAPGMIFSEEASSDQPIYLTEWKPSVPRSVKDALDKLDASWLLPDDTEVIDQLRAATAAKQVSLGFYMRWKWPVRGEVDHKWLKLRSDYYREVRAVCGRGKEGYETVGLVERAIASADTYIPGVLYDAHRKWKAIEGRAEPIPEAVWFDESTIQAAVDLAREQPSPTIIWYQNICVGEALVRAGVATAFAKDPVPADDVVALSIAAHGTGLNLQRFNRNIVLQVPGNPGTWEQMIGRTHRAGQTQPVYVTVLLATAPVRSSWSKAKARARYVEETTGMAQKLNLATQENSP